MTLIGAAQDITNKDLFHIVFVTGEIDGRRLQQRYFRLSTWEMHQLFETVGDLLGRDYDK